jgi:hypothetical protein
MVQHEGRLELQAWIGNVVGDWNFRAEHCARIGSAYGGILMMHPERGIE